MRVLQYIAYFPPHIGGLESHAAQRAKRRIKQEHGTCMVATYSIGQPDTLQYDHPDGYSVVVIPAFEIIPTFPVPKFWTTAYRQAHRLLQDFAPTIVVTRTRFFVASLFGGTRAKMHHCPWVHIEHGVDFVKLNTRWKNCLARCYDQCIGRLIFCWADQVIGISEGCKRFVGRFTKRGVPVIYRGVEFVPAPATRNPQPAVYQLGYVGRLTKLKGVEYLIQACAQLVAQGITNFFLTIVGEGEEKKALEAMVIARKLTQYVTFLGYRDAAYLAGTMYPAMHIVVNASLQEGLPTSVIEGLLAGCVVVATNVGGTPEISDKEDLILVEAADSVSLTQGLPLAFKQWQMSHGLSTQQVSKKFDRSTNMHQYGELFAHTTSCKG